MGANVFLLHDPALPTLIDAGLPRSGRRIVRSLESAGCPLNRLAQVLLTHYHLDHTGAADEVRKATGARLLCHQADADILKDRPRPGGKPWRRVGIPNLEVDGLLKDGQTLPVLGGLQVIHTPGHTPGSLCFYLPQHKALFVGDLFLHTSDRLSRPMPGLTHNADDYTRSIQRVAAMDVQACFPAHGDPILTGAAGLIADLARVLDQPRSKRGPGAALRDVPRVGRFMASLFRKPRKK
jgi:glyoxylase-like metal-dependent hydrolase (beta-lactamase superfamily II)